MRSFQHWLVASLDFKTFNERQATGDWAGQLAVYHGESDELITRVADSTVPVYPGPSGPQLMSDHKLQKGPLIGTENLYLA